MKRHYITIITVLTIGLFLTRCTNNESKSSSDKWYDDTKAEILKQSELKPDSVITVDDTTFIKEHSYFNGKEFHLRWLKNGVLRLETFYSKDGNFELRREICDNGIYGFEGIVYKKNFYGLSTWRNCKGQLNQQGVRHNDKNIGIWKTWDETGKLTEEIDYKNLEKLDSMPIITK